MFACARPTPATSSNPTPGGGEHNAPLNRPGSFYDIRAEVAPLDESADLPPAIQLPVLRTTALPTDEREIRIWTGLVIGYPHSGLVLHVRGDAVRGRLIRYWPTNDTSFAERARPGEDPFDPEALYAYHEAGRCGRIGRAADAIACEVQLRSTPDWRAALVALDSANAWSLPDESALPRRTMVIDGWRMRVEVRRGADYRRYQYSNPNHLSLAEGRAATRIAQIVDSLMLRYAHPANAFVHFTGHYSIGIDTSDFIACGAARSEQMQGNLRSVVAFAGDSAWRRHPAPTRRLYVEGWGTHGPERRVQRGSRWYARSWSVDSVTLVREALPSDCRR